MTHLVYARSQFPLPVCDFINRASLHAADLCNTNIQRSLFCLKSGKFFKIYGEIWEINWEIWAFYYPPCWLNAYSTMKKSSKEEKALVRCRPKFAQRLRKWITKGNPESTERGLESGIQSVPFKIHDCLNYHKWTMAATDSWEEPGRSASAPPSYPTQPQHVPLDV